MRQLLCLLAFGVAATLAQGRGGDPCRDCNEIIGYAEYWLRRNPTATSASTQAELDDECERMGQRDHNQQLGQNCTIVVNTNIALLYSELRSNTSVQQVCYDIKECTQAAINVRRRRQAPTQMPESDPCQMCDFLIRQADRHYRNGTTQQQFQTELTQECTFLGRAEGQQAQTDCNTFVATNIAKLFTDVSKGEHGYQTCVDIGVCTPRTSPAGMKRVKRQAASSYPTESPVEKCQVCDLVIELAEHYYTRVPNITQNDLQTLLIQECDYEAHRQGGGGRQAQAHCLEVITNNIAKIFSDMKAGDSAKHVCYDIGDCASPTGTDVPLPTFHFSSPNPRQRMRSRARFHRFASQQGCQECDMLLNIADQALKRDPNLNEQQMQDELARECQRLHGQDVKNCEQNIHNKTIIDLIFNDLKGGKSVGQCCIDVGACAATGTMRAVRSPRTRDQQLCRTCTIVMTEAERLYAMKHQADEDQFEVDMLEMCQDLKQHEGQQAVDYCTNQTNTNAATIYADVKQGMHGVDICKQLGDC